MTTHGPQFIRAHAYSAKQVNRILCEASRAEGYCDHVNEPTEPRWINGDAAEVQQLVDAYLAIPEIVHPKKGGTGERKRRKDARCLVAGTTSWPETRKVTNLDREKKLLIDDWVAHTFHYLKMKFKGHKVICCVHEDESHVHLHFFVVGNANRLHPGSKAEFVDDKRLLDNKERLKRHKQALSQWGDEYQTKIGQAYGMTRTGAKPEPCWRVKDRAVRSKLLELDKKITSLQKLIAERHMPELQAELGDIRDQRKELLDAAPKHQRRRMSF